MAEILIVMAVFRPNKEFLRQQIASLAGQSFQDFTLLCVDADRSSASVLRELMADYDLCWQLVTPDQTLNAPTAFEYGLEHGRAHCKSARFIALCDQDDIWHPEKLAITRQAIIRTGADMVHSDARLIDAGNAVLAPSLFVAENRQRWPHMRDLLYRNTVTGMTCLMTRDLAERAHPFPPQDGVHYYHDLWLALLARSGAGLHFIPRQLVDYRQHGQNAIGAQPHVPHGGGLRARMHRLLGAYALARYMAHAITDRHHKTQGVRPLLPFVNSQSWGGIFALDTLRHLLAGRFERAYLAAIFGGITLGRRVWAAYQALRGYRAAQHDFDSRLFRLSPGIRPAEIAQTPAKPVSWWQYFDGRVHCPLTPELSADQPHVNILVPSLNPSECYAGIATAIDIAVGLAKRGQNPRLIATDLPIANIHATQNFIHTRGAHIPGPFPVHCAKTTPILASHPADRFLATAWWSAHHCDHLIQNNPYAHRQFLYLIQDYEPCFYPWGDEYAAAQASYDLDFTPIFNSGPLRNYFADQGYKWADQQALCFHPAIDLTRYKETPRQVGHKRTLAFYGRPNVARNLFHMGVQVLGQFIQSQGLGPQDIDLISVGSTHPDIEMPNHITLRNMGKLPWADYPAFLSRVDVGLSLMASPHPSHPPLEMAAAGARVVTNRFGPKDLADLSPLIHSTDLRVEDVVDALSSAWRAPAEQNRHIDLTQLGAPLDQVIDQLALTLGPKMDIAAE